MKSRDNLSVSDSLIGAHPYERRDTRKVTLVFSDAGLVCSNGVVTFLRDGGQFGPKYAARIMGT